MIKLRAADSDELERLVPATWVDSFAKKRPNGIADWVWYEMHRAWIHRLLQTATVMVATIDSVPGECLGWVCYEAERGKHRAAVHYVSVKAKYCKNGIGLSLLKHALEACGMDCQMTHMTKQGERLLARAQ